VRAYEGLAVELLSPRGTAAGGAAEVPVERDEILRVAVDAATGATGPFTLAWRFTPAPPPPVDTTPPTVRITSPAPFAVVHGTIALGAEAIDEGGVDRVVYELQPSGEPLERLTIGTSTAPPYAVALDTTSVEPGVYTIAATAYDRAGNSSATSITITIVQPAPPRLEVAAGAVADATGPEGAVVEFWAWAQDFEGRPLPVVCSPPSGAVFPIGDTTVVCVATDADGRSTTKTIPVHVNGADEQLAELFREIGAVGLEPKLADRLVQQLADVRKQLADGRRQAACGGLDDLAALVARESRRGVTPEQAARYAAVAARVGAVLGCD
jgi:hypothetical protein